MNGDNTFAVLATTQATRGADQGPNHKHVAGYHARPQGPQAGSQFDLANCSSSVYIGEEMDICARAYDGPYINVGRHELEASCSTHLVWCEWPRVDMTETTQPPNAEAILDQITQDIVKQQWHEASFSS
jgi:hypothetical protein